MSLQQGIRVAGLVLAMPTLAALAGCGEQTADQPGAARAAKAAVCDAPRPAKEETRLNSEVEGPYEDESLGETADGSDLVISGTVTQACAANFLSADDSVEYTIFTIEPDAADAQPVKVAYPTAMDGTPVVSEGQVIPTAGDEGVWFLTDVSSQFDFGGYVLTSSTSGIILDDSGRVVNQGTQPMLRKAKALGSKSAILRAAS